MPAAPLPGPSSLPQLSSQPSCSLQRKGLWETPGLFPPIPQCLPAGTACMPCPEPGGTPYPFPFPLLTKEKKEFQTTTRLCGLASYPKLCCQLALCGGGCRQPRTEGYPPVRHCSCVLLFFYPQHALESSPLPKAFPMRLVSGLCSQNPSLCLTTLPPSWLEGSRPPGLTTAFRSAGVSHKDLSSCLQAPVAHRGLDPQAQPPANLLGGAGPSPGEEPATVPVVCRLKCRAIEG